jgi:ribosomal protein S18 acetylase RimI-like enzyme
MTWAIEPLPVDGPLFEAAVAVYAEAFARPPYSDPDRGREVRKRILDQHKQRPGFRFVGAVQSGQRVIAMAYGYRGAGGQWWHDTVCARVSRADRERWFRDSYEVVEVAVAPAFQSLGVGRAVVTALLEGRRESTAVLSTRTDSRAHTLYGRLGFQVITEMRFATNGYPFYVMGKPLNPDPGAT